MLRSVLSLIAGVVAGGLTVSLGEALAHRWFPTPGADYRTPQAAAEALARAPAAALWFLVLAYAVAAVVAGAMTTKLARADSLLPALAVGTILTLAGISNLIAFTHPLWLAIATVTVFVPAALAGGKLVS
jgi:hypothetical protein